jgi:hypothetical protein
VENVEFLDDMPFHRAMGLSLFREKYEHDQAASEVLQEFQTEIALYRTYSEYYSYVFYLLQKESNKNNFKKGGQNAADCHCCYGS